MPFTAAQLAEGELSLAMGPIYTSPGATKTYVKFFNFYNKSAVTVVIDLRIRRGAGTLRKWRRIQLEPDQSYDVVEQDRSVELSASDAFQANSDVAASIDYVITGVTET